MNTMLLQACIQNAHNAMLRASIKVSEGKQLEAEDILNISLKQLNAQKEHWERKN